MPLQMMTGNYINNLFILLHHEDYSLNQIKMLVQLPKNQKHNRTKQLYICQGILYILFLVKILNHSNRKNDHQR